MATTDYAREFFDLPGLVHNLGRHRELIRTMAWRDFTARYRGSFGLFLVYAHQAGVSRRAVSDHQSGEDRRSDG